jgi:hypothetical protein
MLPMPPPEDEGLEGEVDPEMEKQMLAELMEFARGGMSEDLKSRYPGPEGAPMGDAPPAEDPEIPGAEAVPPGEGGEGGELGGAGGLDAETLKALLAKMQAAKGMPPGV